MAFRYYRYLDSSSGTTSNSFSDDWWFDSTSTTNSAPYVSRSTWYCCHSRRILVKNPDHWTEDDALAFVNLVNIETHMAWRVTMLIKGDVLITDPNIESRTMAEFLPLLEWQANRTDLEKIRAFFKEHPLEVSQQPAQPGGNGSED